MPFSDPITAGNVLIRDAIQSPNYVPGVSGWTINKDGSAEFSDVTVRGTIVATSLRTSPGSAVDRIVIVPSVGENSIIFPAAGQSETDARAARISGDSSTSPGYNDIFIGGGIAPAVLNRAYLYVHGNDDTADSGAIHLQGVHGGVWLRALFGQLRIRDEFAEFSDNGSAPLPLLNFGNTIPDARMFQMLDAEASGVLTKTGADVAFGDIPGLTITFTTINANALVAVVGTADIEMTVAGAGLGLGQLLIDGVAEAAQIIGPNVAATRGTYSQTWVSTIATPGSHTVKLQGRKTAGAGTTLFRNLHSKMTVVVLDMFA